MSGALPWLALALIGVSVASAIGAVTARSLFVTCVQVVAAGVSAAAATMLLRSGAGGLAFALLAAAWTPVLMIAAMLLSARAVKAQRGSWPWVSLLERCSLRARWWPLLELRGGTAAPAPEPVPALSFWLAPLVFAAVATCLGALGYGERGALAQGAEP